MKNKITGKLLVLIISICILLCGCGNSKDDTTGKKSAGKCTISVDCSTIWDNEDMLDKSIKDYVPKDGVILKERTVSYYDGETVYDVLKRELKKDNILMEASFTGDSVYVEGINNIYEFSCGEQSGWMYEVDVYKRQSQYGVGDYEARVAATFSNGNPGKAIKLATSEEFKELKQYVVGMFMSLEKGGMDIIGEAIKKTGTFKKQIDEYFSLMRIWFRDILVYKATKEEDQIIFQDEYMTIEKMSQTYSFDDINDILKATDLAESRIKSNVNFDSTIEILLLSIKEKTSGK